MKSNNKNARDFGLTKRN